MRRKTDHDIRKENIVLLICSVFFILFGIFIAVFPHVAPVVKYDSLQTKEVTITEFDLHAGGKSATYFYIRTTDNEKFNITGNFDREQLREVLTEGTSATIKWYKNSPFWTLLVEEITVDGKRVVTYNNDEPVDWMPPLALGGCFALIGMCGLFLHRAILRHNRTIQKKRDERILRKYGKIKK